MNPLKLKDKVAVITGGNSGIGLATARLFVAEGARVVILGQNPSTLENARESLGGGTRALAVNVARVEELKRAMTSIQKELGRIDVLFANAGVAHCPSLGETDDAAFDHVIGINLKGVFFTFTQALPLLSTGASVIFTSSAAQDRGRFGDPLYAASKAAVRSLVRTFAVSEEAAKKRLRINAVVPGCTKTPLTAAATSNPEINAQVEALIPLKRWGESEEIAKAVLFLACDDSSYMTGADIAVDGGLTQV